MPAMLRAAEVGRAMHGRISGALRRTSKDDLHILQPVELDRVTDGSDPLSKSAERPDSPQGRRISTMHNSDPEVVLAAVAAVVAAYTRKPSAATEACPALANGEDGVDGAVHAAAAPRVPATSPCCRSTATSGAIGFVIEAMSSLRVGHQ